MTTMEAAEQSVRYILGTNQAEQDRLRRQSDELRGHTEALLEHVDLREGHLAMDLGCGPSGALEVLAQRVGHSGTVVGLDAQPEHVALARSFRDQRGLANVTIMEGDARHTGLSSSAFDLVHARMLLVNIPDPAEVVTEMVRLVKPGGWVALEEPELLSLCEPPHSAVDQLADVFQTVYRQDGADIRIGRRLSDLLTQAGLGDVGVELQADPHPLAQERRTILLDLGQSMRQKFIDRDLMNGDVFDELDRVARAHLADPATEVLPILYFTAWGRKR